jgi:hypothetical protein
MDEPLFGANSSVTDLIAAPEGMELPFFLVPTRYKMTLKPEKSTSKNNELI